ncbi:MAG: homocysteine S-methyltransferase family protein [Ardenticatenaceae bacterium]
MSTEIQRRGVGMHQEAWSGVAHLSHPDVVLAVHEAYIRAGAQVITTNTFATARHVLDSVGLGQDVVAINREAVEIAQRARDNVADEQVWIAGSLSSMPPLSQTDYTPSGADIERNYREQAEILAEAGVDVLLTEMMLDVENATAAIRACSSVGLPVWVGFSASLSENDATVMGYQEEGLFIGLESIAFGDLVERILAVGGDVAGVMHSQMDVMEPALRVLSEKWSGPKLAYAETGRFGGADWIFEQIISPAAYANEALRWVNQLGVQIIGGCCGTGPEHIRVLKTLLP